MYAHGTGLWTGFSRSNRDPSGEQAIIGTSAVAEDGSGYVRSLRSSSKFDGRRAAGLYRFDRRVVRTRQPAAIAVCAGIVAHRLAMYAGDGRLGALRAG